MIKAINVHKPTLTLIKFSSLSLQPEYEWLIKVISSYNKLNDTIINNIPDLTETQRSFLLNSLNKEADRIALEWNSIGDVSIPNNDNKPCELCGNVHCKEFYVIKNKFTNVELFVGSSCIKRFPSISKSFGEGDFDKVIKLNRLATKKLERENYITKYVGSKEETFIKWSNMKLDYIMDYDTENYRNNLIKIFTNGYNDYVNKGNLNDHHEMDCLNKLKKDILNVNNKIVQNQKEKSIYKFDCPFFIETWLESNSQKLYHIDDAYKTILINIKNNNGKVDEKTIKYLYNSNYIKMLKDVINNKLKLITNIIYMNYVDDIKIHFIISNYKIDFF